MIRSFTLVALILLIGKCFSQVTPSRIFYLDSIPKKAVKLTQGWLFHPGDNPAWAAVNYNDTNTGWQPINPTVERHNLPQVQEAGVYWFRLKMKVDSSLLNKGIAMTVTTRGATEVYLNGELMYKFGTVSPEYALEETRVIYYRPYNLQLADKPIQELAIRQSFHKKNFYVDIIDNAVVLIYLKSSNQAFVDFMRYQGFFQNLRFIQLSFYLPFGLLMLFLYFSYRLRREYLYIGTYALSMFICMLLQVLAEMEGITSNFENFCSFISQLFGFFGMVLFLRGIYLLYKQSSNWVFYLILVGALMIIPGFFRCTVLLKNGTWPVRPFLLYPLAQLAVSLPKV